MNDANNMTIALDYTKLGQTHIAPTLTVGNASVVFIVPEDSNPSVITDTGIRVLRDANILVITDICKGEADVSNRAFIQHIYTYVNVKAAATLDGLPTIYFGNSKWITSVNTDRFIHTLRDTDDTIVVCVKKLLQNNPFLTTRLPHGGKNPIQIIFNRHPRTPPNRGTDVQVPTVEKNNLKLELHAFPTTPISYVESIPKMIGGVC